MVPTDPQQTAQNNVTSVSTQTELQREAQRRFIAKLLTKGYTSDELEVTAAGLLKLMKPADILEDINSFKEEKLTKLQNLKTDERADADEKLQNKISQLMKALIRADTTLMKSGPQAENPFFSRELLTRHGFISHEDNYKRGNVGVVERETQKEFQARENRNKQKLAKINKGLNTFTNAIDLSTFMEKDLSRSNANLQSNAQYFAKDLKAIFARDILEIQPRELFDQKWTDPDANITKLVIESNEKLAAMVRIDVLNAKSPLHLDNIFQFYATAYDECIKQKNYFGAQALLSGLASAPVNRLLYEPFRSKLKEMELQFIEANAKKYRAELAEDSKAEYFVIRNLSLDFKDLTFTQDGSPTYISETQNRSKRIELAQAELQSAQEKLSQADKKAKENPASQKFKSAVKQAQAVVLEKQQALTNLTNTENSSVQVLAINEDKLRGFGQIYSEINKMQQRSIESTSKLMTNLNSRLNDKKVLDHKNASAVGGKEFGVSLKIKPREIITITLDEIHSMAELNDKMKLNERVIAIIEAQKTKNSEDKYTGKDAYIKIANLYNALSHKPMDVNDLKTAIEMMVMLKNEVQKIDKKAGIACNEVINKMRNQLERKLIEQNAKHSPNKNYKQDRIAKSIALAKRTLSKFPLAFYGLGAQGSRNDKAKKAGKENIDPKKGPRPK